MEINQIVSLLVSLGKIAVLLIAGAYLVYLYSKYSKIFIKWIRYKIRGEPEPQPEPNAEQYIALEKAIKNSRKEEVKNE
jgi:hypothetical protein